MGMVSRRGSILIGVLWSLFFLSALAAAIYARVAPQIDFVAKWKDRSRLYHLARAGVKRAMIELDKDETQDFDGLSDTWANNEEAFKEAALGEDGFFSVRYDVSDDDQEPQERYGLTDEERKINPNRASDAVLKHFFEIAGETTSQQAGDITDSILDWVDADDEPRVNGAEKGYYEALEKGYPCKNKEFEMLEELLLVKGMTRGIFDKVKPDMSVHTDGTVNINTAGGLVLQGLGMSESLAEKIIHFREGNDGEEATEDDNVFDSTQNIAGALTASESLSPEEIEQFNGVAGSGILSVRSQHFRGESVGGLKDQQTRRRIIFVADRQKQIKFWRED